MSSELTEDFLNLEEDEDFDPVLEELLARLEHIGAYLDAADDNDAAVADALDISLANGGFFIYGNETLH